MKSNFFGGIRTRQSFSLEARITGIVNHVFQRILANVFFKDWNEKRKGKNYHIF